MYDYWKLWIRDKEQILKILYNSLFEFKQTVNRATGEVHEYPQKANWKNWEIIAFSPALLEIRGSIHKYWNNGTNETFFTYSDAKKAINLFCNEFKLNPLLAKIINLEFGVNVQPGLGADVILKQVICYKNTLASHPYQNNDRSFFLEFKHGEAYIKLYDKGKQLRTTNILRLEVKGMKKRYFQFAGINTLKDLTKKSCMQALGKRITQVARGFVFTDDTLDITMLTNNDLYTYLLMKDASEWAGHRGVKTQRLRTKERRFKTIINQFGKRNIYAYVDAVIREHTTL